MILSAPRSGEGLSLYALKTLLLMLQKAGGDAWREDVQHFIRKGELMDLHSDSARIARTLHVVRPVVETADCAVQATKGRWVGRH